MTFDILSSYDIQVRLKIKICAKKEKIRTIFLISLPPQKKKATAFSKQKVNCKYNFVDFCIFLSQIIISNYCIKCNYDNCL